MVSHEALANHGRAGYLGTRSDDILLQYASPSFDASIGNISLALEAGATLEFGPVGLSPVGRELQRLLVERRISQVVMTPSVAVTLPPGAADSLVNLRCFTVAGEVCPADLPRRYARPHREFVNGYGPTETAITMTVARCGDSRVARCGDSRVARCGDSEAPTIGRPIAGASVEIADARLRAAPAGEAGELLIGGAAVGRGYLNRPSLTAASFVPDAISGKPGRLYRSGDLARIRRNGEIEVLGRIDRQIKIHGCRIEPGEIEAALRDQAGVADAAVVARDGRLAAFVVAHGERAGLVPALRSALGERLPSYMLPSHLETLDRLPLTANGKLDRAELERRIGSAAAPAGRSRAPQGTLEEGLAEIWEEVLDVPRIGADGNFFELGGDSLHAVQVMVRARERIGREVPLRQLFAAPTIAGLARLLATETLDRSPDAGPLHPRRLSRHRPLPLSPPQRQLWFLDQLSVGDAAYNMTLTLRFEQPLDLEILRRSLDHVVDRHEILRTRLVAVDGTPWQMIDRERVVPVTVVDLTGAPPAERRHLGLERAGEELRRPFDLARDVMLRALVLRFSERRQLVVLIMHHIASDGWSIGVLLREIAALYAAFGRGEPSPLAPLGLQYADVARWQEELLAGPRLDQLLGYWRRRLAGAPQVLELPFDRPRPPEPTKRGATVAFAVGDGRLDQLEALARSAGATRFMVLLAAFDVLLFRWSGLRDLVLSVPTANRFHPASEQLVGFFTNLLVFRIRLRPHESFRDLLGRVRVHSLDAFSHQDMPFDRLIADLVPERRRGQIPFVEVGFVVQNVFSSEDMPGLSIEDFPLHSGSSRFDLSLSMFEQQSRIDGELEYRTDLFDATTVRRLGAGFATLVAALAEDPTTPVEQLPVLGVADRHQLVQERSTTSQPTPVSHVGVGT